MTDDEGLSPAEVTNIIAEVMEKADLHPALIFAVRKCGFIVTSENADSFDDEDLAAWDAAIETWFALHPDAEPL